MANALLSPDSDQDERLNKGQEDYDRRFAEIAEREERAQFDDIVGNQEENPLSDEGGSWDQNYKNENGLVEKGKKEVAKAVVKKAGIPFGAVGIIAIIIAVFGSFLPASFVLLNLGESSVVNRDTTSPILRKRFDKVLDRKLNSVATSGCTPVKVNCRFTRLSNNFIDTLSKNGITAYGADGKPIEPKKGGFVGQKPVEFEFQGKRISAAAFVKEKNANSALKKAFHSAYNARFLALTNSSIKKLFFKANKLDQSGESTKKIDPDDTSKSLKEIGDGVEKNKIASADNKISATEEAIKEGVEKETKKSLKKVGNSTGAVEVATIASCVVSSAPGIWVNLSRLYQMRQQIAIASSVVLVGYSMIKNGEMDAATMATIGTMLTATTLDSTGKKTSAMDAFAIKSILFGDAGSKDKSYEKFIPGKAAMDIANPITNVTESGFVKETCSLAMSPAASVGFAAAQAARCTVIPVCVAEGVLSGLIIAADATGLTSKVIDLASPAIGDAAAGIIKNLPPETIENAFGNDAITKAKGKDFGEVLGMGLAFAFQGMALKSGGGAMTKIQAANYDTLMNETIAEYAEEERAAKNPFDPSSPYTFLGSIVSNFYKASYAAGDSSGSIISGLGYLISQPARILTGSNTVNAKPGLSESQCNNSEAFGVSEDICIGPFGEVYAGIPAEYLNASNDTVVESVTSEVEDSGEIKSTGKIQEWQDSCSDGSLFNVEGCVITDQETANLSIYQYDLILAEGFDEGFDEGISDTSSSKATTSGTWTHPLGEGEFLWSSYSGSRSHDAGAVDFAQPMMTPVYSVSDGIATDSTSSGGYGYSITITHPDGTSTQYAHFPNPALVNVGDSVKAGQQIGVVGSTGYSTGPHLHFEPRDASGNTTPAYVYMKERGVELGPCNKNCSVPRGG